MCANDYQMKEEVCDVSLSQLHYQVVSRCDNVTCYNIVLRRQMWLITLYHDIIEPHAGLCV